MNFVIRGILGDILIALLTLQNIDKALRNYMNMPDLADRIRVARKELYSVRSELRERLVRRQLDECDERDGEQP